jgi:hypothetical protein
VRPVKAPKPSSSGPDGSGGPGGFGSGGFGPEPDGARPGEVTSPSVPTAFAEDRPRPIGPERLKALREAIRDGTYPLDRAVQSGLLRMFRKP